MSSASFRGPALPCLVVALLTTLAIPASAQRGDRAGEEQHPLPADLVVPAAIVRDPAAEAATFRVAPGFHCELFAAEPLLGDPVAASFDAAGRLWVVEMRNFMLDHDARDEDAPTGRIVVLEDTDGDHRADKVTVFHDHLVLPRAVLPLRGGALVIAPPNLLWLPDTDGDLHADGERTICGGFEAGTENPEHSGNGLLWGLDNRIHLADDKRMLHCTPAGFAIEQGAGGGQWGITQDDRGRLYFNYNEDWLRCDLIPTRYGPASATVGGTPLLNHRLCPSTTVWPIHMTPGVNRGYQPGRLVDWKLAIHTAVCAPLVYRGGLLPQCDGDVFVCEPAANLVRRMVLSEPDGLMGGANVYEAERTEFFASSDERCRPVNLLTGPDGALYIVDMYRGVLQHKNFVTTFLRRQIVDRKLEQPTGLGRIWRIVPDAVAASAPFVSLQDAPVPQLVDALANANGGVRDLALRELVQRQELGAADLLRERLAANARPAVRIVLLAALQGLDRLTTTDLRRALRDADAGVITFALQHVAPALVAGDALLWSAVEALAAESRPNVRWHAVLALGDVLASTKLAPRRERALAAIATLAATGGDDAGLRAVVATASQAELVEILRRVAAAAPSTTSPDPGTARLVRDLAARAMRRRQAPEQQRLLALAVEQPPFAAEILLGIVDALPKAEARAGWLQFEATPPALVQLAASKDAACARLAQQVLGAVALVGKPTPGVVTELNADEVARVQAGAGVFARVCAQCHQLDGQGQQGLAPPLRDSEWVLGPPGRLVQIALHGVRGPIEVDGTTWALEMTPQGYLPDDQLAQALSYLRRAFGHRAATVAPDFVAGVRKQHGKRVEPWTAEELLGSK